MSNFDIVGSFIAALLSMVLGFIWYSEALFGARFRKEMGFSDEMMREKKKEGMKGMKKQISLGFIAEFVTALVFSYTFFIIGISSVGDALVVAFLAWLGFSATLQFGGTLWAGDSMSLFILNTSHRLASFVVIVLALILI
jgi:hypothetical protein